MTTEAKCNLCGEPMPPGEEMFNFHGYSGPCPKPPLAKAPETITVSGLWLRSTLKTVQMLAEVDGEWRLVAEELLEAPFSHIAEPAGAGRWPIEKREPPPEARP